MKKILFLILMISSSISMANYKILFSNSNVSLPEASSEDESQTTLASKMAAGYDFAVIIKNDGSLYAWGLDPFGVVNNVPAGNDFVMVSAGNQHAIAMKSNGDVIGWGRNREGSTDTITGKNFKSISAGNGHNVGLLEDGSVYSWGADGYNQVSGAPITKDFVAVKAGGVHSVALKSDGSIVDWGYAPSISGKPTLSNFNLIGAGDGHSLALNGDNGNITLWGNTSDFNTAVYTPSKSPIYLDGGRRHAVALNSDGTVTSFGANFTGEVNNNPTENGFVAVEAGRKFSLGLKNTGELVLWGSGESNQMTTNFPSNLE